MKKFTALLLVLAMALALCGCASAENKEAYENANACFAQKRYVDAATFYLKAEGYKDSQQKLLEIYYIAVNLYESNQYADALPLFSILASAEINDSARYDAVLTAFVQFFRDYDVRGTVQTLDPYRDLPGVTDFIKEIESLCYEGTYLIRYDSFAEKLLPESETYTVKEKDSSDTYSGYSSATKYEYYPQKHPGNAQSRYLQYITDLGAKTNDDGDSTFHFYHLTPFYNKDLFKDSNLSIMLTAYDNNAFYVLGYDFSVVVFCR